ncbi:MULTISPECIES: D-alanyl-D-alanine carboxypeptidase family protein [Rhizobium]|uniref:D-alanyl-D-alanine carboxypeptidase n=1 Tax=Rhizobium rhododendri TaxID=2506430 RepID=A0ABY8IFD7_9HYPH|nr:MULTISPECIES: D-alanyl-D-alanine carboxypeptidase family protein [Rhizobium]MBO9100074.1 D-alanyl-D-alanine carboxypeptidase [Rhizobium sp. L58/93]MBO9170015.1 D-alanyl-D-alanine carboxypeptidase [Rhizobium sp. L245/93]MBO9185967.1 D-alanyl-D-alanine carboxypeptidase [Rhizobium sp. E27B/91]MBO9135769.1 D-alanyl-D-alanine carboxypeptidase [Rhizobium sp. B209b/85]MBZ5760896.1 D-alanyl-D-alanine carboxypeptidase [Rhizobium sp. VS19-DR96]
MPTKQNSLFAALRLLPVGAAVTALFLSGASAAFANPHILVDVSTGRVLEHEEAFRKWYPASLTKLMTVYTTFRAIQAGQISLDTPVVMSKHAAAQPAAKMYFKPGQKMTLDNALKMMLVKSANDLAMAVAETVGGSEQGFVAKMNAEAARLGMTSSHFINPNGLPGKGQYTTARDLAIVTVALRREFPQYAGYFALEGFTNGVKQVPNINLLIGRYNGADGMKTGFICASGFNQIASATRNGRTLVSVVLGTNSLAERADMSADMLEKGFTSQFPGNDTLQTLKPYGPGQDQVADVTNDICSAKGAQMRSETRDPTGRMKVLSPYIHEMTHTPNFTYAGLIGGGPDAAADKASVAKSSQQVSGDVAGIPVPQPRPTN